MTRDTVVTKAAQAEGGSEEFLLASGLSRDVAHEIERGATRRTATPLRRSFVWGLDDPPTFSPLIDLYRGAGGGRGEAVVIRTYLAIVWKCSAPPYSVQAPARAWAELLDLPKPGTEGAKRVRQALRKLAKKQLVKLETERGEVTRVTLLQEDGQGAPYTLPSTEAQKAKAGKRGKAEVHRHRYLKISNKLWTEGHLPALGGPALVMLLIILGEGGDRGEAVWFSVSRFRDRYGLSHTTKSKGVAELVGRGIITKKGEPSPGAPGGSRFERFQRRNRYTVDARFVPSADE